jgi:RNA polymerase sigma factor (sigma-70 family)
MTSSSQDTGLLEKQFNVIVEGHKGILYKIANSYCSDRTARQDLLQEILIQLWRSLPYYNPAFALTTWLYRVALNTAISYYR